MNGDKPRYWNTNTILQVAVIAVLGFLTTELIDMRDYVKWSKGFHDEIAPDFFHQTRWGYEDELKMQAAMNHEKDLLYARIGQLSKEIDAHTNLIIELEIKIDTHDQEADMWKDKIRDLNSRRKYSAPPNGVYP
jgi:hypothetical protein